MDKEKKKSVESSKQIEEIYSYRIFTQNHKGERLV